MRWDASPWTPWGLPWSERDGYPTLAESTLWELEARHPQVFRRLGDRIYLHLDRVYRVVERSDRAYVSLVAEELPLRDEPVPLVAHEVPKLAPT